MGLAAHLLYLCANELHSQAQPTASRQRQTCADGWGWSLLFALESVCLLLHSTHRLCTYLRESFHALYLDANRPAEFTLGRRGMRLAFRSGIVYWSDLPSAACFRLDPGGADK